MNDIRALATSSVLAVITFTAVAFASGCAETYEPVPSDCDCATGRACARGACVAADCEADIGALATTLDPSISIVQSFCLDLAEGPIGAFARSDGDLDILHAHVSTDGRDSTVVLDSFVGSVETGALSVGVSCATTFTAESDGVTVRLSRDLAVSPDGGFVAWGLRAMAGEPGTSSLDVGGAWYLARRDGCAVETRPFARVEGVAFGSDGRGPHVLVSGGLGGPVYMDGVFLDGSRVLAESTPGSIWRLGDSVIVGGVLGHGVAPATLIPLASVRDGAEVQRGENGVVSGDAQTHRFVLLDGRGIVSEARSLDAGRAGLEVRSLDVRADGLVFGEPVLLAGPDFTAAAPVQGARRFLLRHARGVLLVE